MAASLRGWSRTKVKGLHFHQPTPWWQRVLVYGLIGLLALAVVGAISITILLFILARGLPSPEELVNINIAESTHIYDRDGKSLYEIHGNERRTIVPLRDISPYIVTATLAVEDSDFYLHGGFDWKGIARATVYDIWHRFTGKARLQGGSTITQQFIKNAFLSRERTFTRKIKELILALQLEKNFTKDEILAFYLNQISYGADIHGVQAASRAFFGKDAAGVTLAEAAALAAIPKAPTYFSPYGDHRSELMSRQQYVLNRLENLGKASPADLAVARAEKIIFQPLHADIRAPHFVFYVRELLEERFGKDFVAQGGLKVTTTLSGSMQTLAEQAIQAGVERNRKVWDAKNAGLVAVDPKNGEILAMVGSYDFFEKEHDGQVNVTLAKRQPGSSFKPFVYATAFMKGHSPATVIFDVPTDFSVTDEPYTPGNYTETFQGPVSARSALAQSINIPGVKMLYLAGVNDVINQVSKMGITTLNDPNRYGLSLVLGGGEVKLLEMAGAYGVFATNGVFHALNPILSIEDKDGNNIYQREYDPGKIVLPDQIAYLINDILSDNQARTPIFGWNNSLYLGSHKVAAKTGTTNAFRDAWTIGYTPSLVAGVWVGNNDNTPMKKKSDGSTIAAPIWKQFMQSALANTPNEEFQRPSTIVEKVVSTLDGLLPNAYTPTSRQRTEIFAQDYNVPTKVSTAIQTATICAPTRKLANQFCPDYLRQTLIYLDMHSLFQTRYQWEQPAQEWLQQNQLLTAQEFNNQVVVAASKTELPTEVDTTFSAETAKSLPSIQILAPQPEETVYFGTIPVRFLANTPNGFKRVQFFFGPSFRGVVNNAAQTEFLLEIIPGFEPNQKYIIRAVIVDQLGLQSEASLPVFLSDLADPNATASIDVPAMPDDRTYSIADAKTIPDQSATN